MLSIQDQLAIIRDLLPDAEEIAPGIVQATCPGADLHSTSTGKRDFRIWLDDTHGPHEHCMHKSCAQARDAFMRELYKAIGQRDHAQGARQAAYVKARTQWQKAPEGRPEPAEPFNLAAACEVADLNPVQVVDDDWLRAHSPVAIPRESYKWPELLLSNLYTPEDNIIIFTKFASQGQLLYTPGQQPRRLEEYPPPPGVMAPARPVCPFPKGAANGVWFLAAPVTGEWMPNPNNPGKNGAPKFGRRHAACATRFPYLVLESDDAPPEVWLRILTQLTDPIVAIYTSGGKSYHALVRVNCSTKEQFDLRRREFITRLAALGADPAAITAVRLTRLPGCLRYGSGEGPTYRAYVDDQGREAPRLQRLLYLNPQAQDGKPIIEHY